MAPEQSILCSVDSLYTMTMRKISLGFFILTLCSACNPYLTKRINRISKSNSGDSIFVMYPITETRRQITNDSYTDDLETFQSAEDLTKKALHGLFDNRLKVRYGESDFGTFRKTKTLLDSVLKKFADKKYKKFIIDKKSETSSSSNLILIPYLIWTRTTEDFEKEKCGLNGKIYALAKDCRWTDAKACLLLIDRKKGEVVYFKQNWWRMAGLYFPYEQRITRSLKECSQPLLRKLR